MADEETVRFYNENAIQYAELTSRHSMLSFVERFTAMLPPAASVIDVGCGGGRDMIEFRRRELQVIGLDAAFELARLAKARSNSPSVVGEMANLPFASSIFDGVWASASFLHLPGREIAVALQEANRVLKRGGFFFSSIKQGSGEKRGLDRRFFNYFSPEEWAARLGDAGFSVVSLEWEASNLASSGDNWISAFARKAV